MKRTLARLVILATLLVTGSRASAGIDLTPEQIKTCEKTFQDSKSWGSIWNWPYPLVAKLKDGSVSPECKAEIEDLAKKCMTSDSEKNRYKDLAAKNPGMVLADWCNNSTFSSMGDSYTYELQKVESAKKREAELAAEEQKRQGETAKVELPKATQHNAGLEKAVAAAYAKDYPEGKVLKVILGSWADDMEKDSFGRVTGRDLNATVVNKQPDGKCQLHDELWMQHGNGRSFSGPLSARGAGSMTKTEILCSKVEAGASEAAPKKKRK
jgi:hypothetical protein